MYWTFVNSALPRSKWVGTPERMEALQGAVRKFIHDRLAVGEEAQSEYEDWHDFSFSNGDTRTGTFALAGR